MFLGQVSKTPKDAPIWRRVWAAFLSGCAPRDTPDARKFFKGWLCSGVSFGIASPAPCASIAFCDGLASYCQGGRVSDLISDLGSLPCHSF